MNVRQTQQNHYNSEAATPENVAANKFWRFVCEYACKFLAGGKSGGSLNSPWNYNSHETTTLECSNSISWGPKAVTAVKWRLLHPAIIERQQLHSQQPPDYNKSEPTAVKWRVRNSTRSMRFCVVSWLLSFQVPFGILWERSPGVVPQLLRNIWKCRALRNGHLSYCQNILVCIWNCVCSPVNNSKIKSVNATAFKKYCWNRLCRSKFDPKKGLKTWEWSVLNKIEASKPRSWAKMAENTLLSARVLPQWPPFCRTEGVKTFCNEW